MSFFLKRSLVYLFMFVLQKQRLQSFLICLIAHKDKEKTIYTFSLLKVNIVLLRLTKNTESTILFNSQKPKSNYTGFRKILNLYFSQPRIWTYWNSTFLWNYIYTKWPNVLSGFYLTYFWAFIEFLYIDR